MNGLPLKIEVQGEEETILFATRRIGEEGQLMRAAKRRYYDAVRRMSVALQKVILLGDRAEQAKEADLPALLDEQDKHSAEQLDAKADAEDAAVEYLTHSLAGNYGVEKAEEILSLFSDGELNDLVKFVEVGDLPEDFFTSRATRQKRSSTGPSKDEHSSLSLDPDSLARSTGLAL